MSDERPLEPSGPGGFSHPGSSSRVPWARVARRRSASVGVIRAARIAGYTPGTVLPTPPTTVSASASAAENIGFAIAIDGALPIIQNLARIST